MNQVLMRFCLKLLLVTTKTDPILQMVENTLSMLRSVMLLICSIVARQAQSCVVPLLFHHVVGPKRERKMGEKEEKRKKQGRNSKKFLASVAGSS
jgi:hypothetical protein